MKKTFMKLSGCALGAIMAMPAMAETSNSFPTGLQLGVGLSVTSGLNGFVGYANKKFDSFWWKRLGARLDFATTSPLRSTIDSMTDKYMGDEGIEVDDDLRVKSGGLNAKHVAALVDFYPFGDTWFLGGWRLTGGYYTGKFDLSAKMVGVEGSDIKFELNHQEYKYEEGGIQAKANANWKYNGPYVGTGFDLGLGWGFKIYMDVGVVFTSKVAQLGLDIPTEGLKQWNESIDDWDDVDLDQLEINKNAEIKDAQDELDKYKYFPIVKIGFMYRF